MNSAEWKKHLSQWEQFLRIRMDLLEDDGLTRVQIKRQLSALANAELSAVQNPKLLSEFINPTAKLEFSIPEQFYLPLNRSQKEAVSCALAENPLTLIQGPPGTGKTQVIAEICLQLFKQNPNIKILVCSQTHVAVNNLISRISKYCSKEDISQNKGQFLGLSLLRIKDKEGEETVSSFLPQAVLNQYYNWLDHFCVYNEAKNAILQEFYDYGTDNSSEYRDKTIEKALALSTNVVGMTCNRVGAYSFSSSLEKFDIIIIDEVCKATLPEILQPLEIAEKAILVGDPKQLPPIFCREEKDRMSKNIEECHLHDYFHIDSLFQISPNTITLDTQYRMSKTIGRMISEVFYRGRLQNGRNLEGKPGIRWIDYLPESSDMVENVMPEGTHEIYNLKECDFTYDILLRLDEKFPNDPDDPDSNKVAVISPYKGQVEKIKSKIKCMKKSFKNIKVNVNTVDSFQGKESAFVIFSVTRTKGPDRFWSDNRRLNVALSRAKNGIFIIGYKDYALKNPLLRDILQYCI